MQNICLLHIKFQLIFPFALRTLITSEHSEIVVRFNAQIYSSAREKGRKMKNRIMQSSFCCCVLSFILLISAASASELYANKSVYVGGMPFGVRFQAGEVSVLRTRSFFSEGKEVSPAAEAGVLANDVIRSINAQPVSSMSDLTDRLKEVDKEPITVTLERGPEKISTVITPRKCDETGKYQLGLLLKDSAAGIGTVTFIFPDTLRFAGLGHGICDADTGKILEIPNGYITDVTVTGISKGIPGTPGELKGTLDADKCGKLLRNCEVGVFGIYTDAPTGIAKTVPLADAEEVADGKATILCTLDDNRTQEYEIEIKKIDKGATSKTKNYQIHVTDEALLQKTGGIVQGMSGSPILQNGKLVGAVTHVMINDPTTGYGIYIGNMLREQV